MRLHDIAKGRGGGHVAKGVVLARRILARLGIAGEVADDACSWWARTSRCPRPRSSATSASRRSSRRSRRASAPCERLNLLMLLTYADHVGVGPGHLERAGRRRCSGTSTSGRGASSRPAPARRAPGSDRLERERAAATLRREFPEEEVERHFALLPERYLRATDAARLASHFRLVRSRGEHPAAFDWADLGDGRGSELTLSAEDRPGLFALLAGTLSVHGIDILGADLFARHDGVVIDTLRVAEVPGQRPLRPERRARLEAALLDAVAGRFAVDAAVARWRADRSRRPRRTGGRAARRPPFASTRTPRRSPPWWR